MKSQKIDLRPHTDPSPSRAFVIIHVIVFLHILISVCCRLLVKFNLKTLRKENISSNHTHKNKQFRWQSFHFSLNQKTQKVCQTATHFIFSTLKSMASVRFEYTVVHTFLVVLAREVYDLIQFTQSDMQQPSNQPNENGMVDVCEFYAVYVLRLLTNRFDDGKCINDVNG